MKCREGDGGDRFSDCEGTSPTDEACSGGGFEGAGRCAGWEPAPASLRAGLGVVVSGSTDAATAGFAAAALGLVLKRFSGAVFSESASDSPASSEDALAALSRALSALVAGPAEPTTAGCAVATGALPLARSCLSLSRFVAGEAR